MNAGDLRHRLSVQTRTETSDGHDGVDDSWATGRSRIAGQVQPLVGRDLQNAAAIDPRISHQVSLRYWRTYLDDLAGGRARLLLHPTSGSQDDRTFEVVAPPIDVDEMHVELRLLCRELQ